VSAVRWVNAPLAAAIWNSDIASSTDLVVLLAIATFADRTTQEAHPAIPTLASRARLDKKTIPDSLKRLEQAGLLAVDRRPNRAATLRILVDAGARNATAAVAVPEGQEWMTR